MILLAFAHARYWPYLVFRVMGLANVFDDAGVYSALRQVIPSRLTGRALGARRAVLLLSMGLGSAVAPLLIHAWGARGTLIATGALLVVIAALFMPSLSATTAGSQPPALISRCYAGCRSSARYRLRKSSTSPACCSRRHTSPGT